MWRHNIPFKCIKHSIYALCAFCSKILDFPFIFTSALNRQETWSPHMPSRAFMRLHNMFHGLTRISPHLPICIDKVSFRQTQPISLQAWGMYVVGAWFNFLACIQVSNAYNLNQHDSFSGIGFLTKWINILHFVLLDLIAAPYIANI